MKQNSKLKRTAITFLIGTLIWTGLPCWACAKEKGIYPARAGTILVTPDNENKMARVFKLGHAAIVLNKSTVVEATLPRVTVSKNAWKNRSQVKKVYGLNVKTTSASQDEQAAQWCRRQVGKPYNINYTDVNTRKKFYCSQLVWAAFWDNFRVNLNTPAFGKMVSPMELVNSRQTGVIYTYSR